MTTANAAAAVGSSVGCRRCDFCEEARALVYCRADSARLCLACDRHVHSANAVSSKHPRSLLCDACLSAPSSILLCSSQRHHGGQPRLLCANCDFDARDSQREGSRAGERRAVEPYSGSPAAVEMLALLGVFTESEKSLLLDDGDSGGPLDGGDADDGSFLLLAEEGWFWDTPPILSLEDIIVPISPCHGFQALGVPPPPKDRNAACGKHKDEILGQLRKLVKSEVCVSSDFGLFEAGMGFQCRQKVQMGDPIPSIENGGASVVVPSPPAMLLQSSSHGIDVLPAFSSEHQRETSIEESKVFLDGPTDDPGNVSDRISRHLMSGMPSLSPKCGHKLLGLDRDNVLSRYKEKRKTRRFVKQIRYESRKVRADGRMRIKGRFAKVN